MRNRKKGKWKAMAYGTKSWLLSATTSSPMSRENLNQMSKERFM